MPRRQRERETHLTKQIVLLAALAALSASAFAADTTKPSAKDHAKVSHAKVSHAKVAAKAAPKKVKVADVRCPVTGDKIAAASLSKSLKSTYKGKTYYFCCPSCKPTFDKNPAKYSKS